MHFCRLPCSSCNRCLCKDIQCHLWVLYMITCDTQWNEKLTLRSFLVYQLKFSVLLQCNFKFYHISVTNSPPRQVPSLPGLYRMPGDTMDSRVLSFPSQWHTSWTNAAHQAIHLSDCIIQKDIISQYVEMKAHNYLKIVLASLMNNVEHNSEKRCAQKKACFSNWVLITLVLPYTRPFPVCSWLWHPTPLPCMLTACDI